MPRSITLAIDTRASNWPHVAALLASQGRTDALDPHDIEQRAVCAVGRATTPKRLNRGQLLHALGHTSNAGDLHIYLRPSSQRYDAAAKNYQTDQVLVRLTPYSECGATLLPLLDALSQRMI